MKKYAVGITKAAVFLWAAAAGMSLVDIAIGHYLSQTAASALRLALLVFCVVAIGLSWATDGDGGEK